ncbi:hypothetical protein WJX72_009109 [[Myrmecia] bisecta]|uniref:Uncharacterized protein n=1 Tax=[Myrmecia] bisecta TaxID=41462 RepID=A0AAW1R7N4_9CHLO
MLRIPSAEALTISIIQLNPEGEDWYRSQHRILEWNSPPTGQQGILFLEGFSVCCMEFHLNAFSRLSWPTEERYLYKWRPDKLSELTSILEQNDYQMIVIPALVHGLKDNCEEVRNVTASLERLKQALKAAVTEKGATLVLFCCEKVDSIYKGMFGKSWQENQYVRTSCFQTAQAKANLPGAPPSINAKAIHLVNVPEEEQVYVTIPGRSTNNSLIPSIYEPLQMGMVSVAAGPAGTGRIVYLGDVNSEVESCKVVQSIAKNIFGGQSRRGPPASGQTASRSAAAGGRSAIGDIDSAPRGQRRGLRKTVENHVGAKMNPAFATQNHSLMSDGDDDEANQAFLTCLKKAQDYRRDGRQEVSKTMKRFAEFNRPDGKKRDLLSDDDDSDWFAEFAVEVGLWESKAAKPAATAHDPTSPSSDDSQTGYSASSATRPVAEQVQDSRWLQPTSDAAPTPRLSALDTSIIAIQASINATQALLDAAQASSLHGSAPFPADLPADCTARLPILSRLAREPPWKGKTLPVLAHKPAGQMMEATASKSCQQQAWELADPAGARLFDKISNLALPAGPLSQWSERELERAGSPRSSCALQLNWLPG